MRCLVTAIQHVKNIRAIARQPLIVTIEKLLKVAFFLGGGSAPGYVTRTPGQLRRIERVQLLGIRRTGRTWAREAEESPSLVAVVRKWLLETRRDGEWFVKSGDKWYHCTYLQLRDLSINSISHPYPLNQNNIILLCYLFVSRILTLQLKICILFCPFPSKSHNYFVPYFQISYKLQICWK
jgi:hypothetical protein